MHDIYIQQAAKYRERKLLVSLNKHFLGSARVSLDQLEIAGSNQRVLDPDNIERLVHQFKLIGCQRLDRQYHVPVEIDTQVLDDVLRDNHKVAVDLHNSDQSQIPLLVFTASTKLQCLHGRHRIHAARRHLRGDDRWWVVDFFAASHDVTLQRFWHRHTFDEQPLSAGEIYFEILRCDPEDVLYIDQLWARIRSSNERRELKRLDQFQNLKEAFRELAEFPCFGKQMLAGNVGSLLRLKYFDECTRYLRSISQSWRDLLGSNRSPRLLDYVTVQQIQGRAPANCRHDHNYLQQKFTTKQIFTGYPAGKSDIWNRLKRKPGRWLSLFTFFEDMKYLEMIAACVRKLVPMRRRQTQREAFEQASVSSGHAFDDAYHKAHIYVMRHIESLRPGSVRVERDENRISQAENAHTWYHFASFLHRLGFNTSVIAKLLKQDVSMTAASEALRQALDPAYFNCPNDDLNSYAEQVAQIFRKVQSIDNQAAAPLLITTEDKCENISRRYGRPFRKAFESYSRMLSLQNMKISSNKLRDGLRSRSQDGLAPFYVQHAIFTSFFSLNFVSADEQFHVIDEIAEEDDISPKDVTHDTLEISAMEIDIPESAIPQDVPHVVFG